MRTHILPECVTTPQIYIAANIFICNLWKVNSPRIVLPQCLFKTVIALVEFTMEIAGTVIKITLLRVMYKFLLISVCIPWLF